MIFSCSLSPIQTISYDEDRKDVTNRKYNGKQTTYYKNRQTNQMQKKKKSKNQDVRHQDIDEESISTSSIQRT